jgi:hypothetical protein
MYKDTKSELKTESPTAVKPPETIVPMDVIREIEKLNGKSKTVDFPLDAFPTEVQDIIQKFHDRNQYPIPFTASSIICAATRSGGSLFSAKILGTPVPPIIYMAIIGKKGTNKTWPLTSALNAIKERDREHEAKYMELKAAFDEYEKLSTDEKAQVDDLVKPKQEHLYTSDLTLESLSTSLPSSPRGIMIYRDELMGFLSNSGRYNGGSDDEAYIEAWNGGTTKITRAGKDSVTIQWNVSICGTIQPEMLNDMTKGRYNNGLIDRFLFEFPDGLKKQKHSDEINSEEHKRGLDRIMFNLLDEEPYYDEFGIVPLVFTPSPEARKIFKDWQSDFTDKVNHPDNEGSWMNTKMDLHCYRIALSLHLIKRGLGSKESVIDGDTAHGAIKLAEYYLANYQKIMNLVSGDDPIENLPSNKKKFFELLSLEFSRHEAKEIALKYELMGERSVAHFLKTKELFERVEHGRYRKLIV